MRVGVFSRRRCQCICPAWAPDVSGTQQELHGGGHGWAGRDLSAPELRGDLGFCFLTSQAPECTCDRFVLQQFDYKIGFWARSNVAHNIMSASCPCPHTFSLRILQAAVTLHVLLPGAAQVLHVLLWQLSGSDCTALSLELQKVQYRSVTTS